MLVPYYFLGFKKSHYFLGSEKYGGTKYGPNAGKNGGTKYGGTKYGGKNGGKNGKYGKYGGKNGGKNGKNGGKNGKNGGKNGPNDGKNGGKNGAATGVTELEAADAADVASPLPKVTVKVYAVPRVSPVTIIGDVAPVAVIDPGDEVTVYVVPSGFPRYVGAVNETETLTKSDADAEPIVGAPGCLPSEEPVIPRISAI